MKLTLAIFQLDRRGGKERDCLAVAGYLAERGYDVTVVTTARPSMDAMPFRIVTLPRRGLTNHARLHNFARMAISYCSETGSGACLAFERVPGAQFFYGAEDSVAFKARALRSVLPRYKIRLALERGVFAAPAPTFCFFLTERQRLEFSDLYGVEEGRGVVLPPVLHDDRFDMVAAGSDPTRTREHLGLPAKSRVAISIAVSSVLDRKGVDRTLDALVQVPDLYFVVVGSDDRRLRRRVESLGLDQRVRIIPFASNVMELISASDFLVHPARSETAGQIIGEALLAATPVITSGVCGYATYVERSGAGIVLSEPFQQRSYELAVSDVMTRLPEVRSAAVRESQRLKQERGRWLSVIADEIERRASARRC